MYTSKTFSFVFFFVLLGSNLSAQLMRSSKHFDADLPNIELNPDYGFIFPVFANILTQVNYTPSYGNRYFMSLFGPRYVSTSGSSIQYYDFHQGADITNVVTWNNVVYDDNNLYHIVCNCDGVINSITDGTDAYLETTANGRSVQVKCDSTFRNEGNWGNIFINYRHLSDLYTLTDLAKISPPGTIHISKGDTIGVVGESGITSTLHLHTSIQRYETGTNTTNYKNVHPYRIYPPTAAPHLHKILENAQFKLLESWADSALVRVYIPYNEMSVKRLEVINNEYSNYFDYEDVSDSTDRDNHALIPGFEVFAYSFNRGLTALNRYNSSKATMPAVYPASPNRDLNQYFHPITADSGVYIMDVKLTDLPNGYNAADFVFKLSDIYGNVVLADFGSVWDGNIWVGGNPTAATNAVIASSNPPGPFACRNLTINEGVALNSDADNISVSGNVSNYGNGILGSGVITFDKSGIAILFEDTLWCSATINVASGTTLSTHGLLKLTASSATQYGQLLGDGDVDGAVSVQAFLDGIGPNQARYFYLGSPVTDAKINDFNEGNILVAANNNQGSIW